MINRVLERVDQISLGAVIEIAVRVADVRWCGHTIGVAVVTKAAGYERVFSEVLPTKPILTEKM